METQKSPASQSSETLTGTPAGKRTQKPAAKKSKSSAASKSPKRSPKKKAKPAAKNAGGRPMLYPDKTILRLPAGSLKVINASAKRSGKSQGEYLRGIIARYV